MDIKEIEQTLPKKPNFGLVVGLACAVLVVIFGLALFFLEIDNGHLTLRHHSAHPTSQLTMPQVKQTSSYLGSAA